ncbi:hypothetical protein BD560DRAFT_473627, partial [Blakeslea trispora]
MLSSLSKLHINSVLPSYTLLIVISTITTFDKKKFIHIILQNTLPIRMIIVAQPLDERIIEQSSQHQELPFLREVSCYGYTIVKQE